LAALGAPRRTKKAVFAARLVVELGTPRTSKPGVTTFTFGDVPFE